MKEFGSDGDVSLGGEAFANVANVRVDPEGFLEDEKSGMRAGGIGARDVGAHGSRARNFQLDIFFQDRSRRHGDFQPPRRFNLKDD
jgi:hypothetical protein